MRVSERAVRRLWAGTMAFCIQLSGASGLLASPEYVPPPPREFRGAWVATVANIDWPSKPGLPVDRQKAEAVAILDRAVELNLNAIAFQVRPAADALYRSDLEPWSAYLTGTQGEAPEPGYDPLAFWVEESHSRGIQLHAWFNPFRARQEGHPGELAGSHVARTHPDWVREYGGMLWMDPGIPEVRQRTLDVILDVVRRYDVDGVHMDDYFYPYPVSEGGREVDFPDEPSWRAYRESGGTLARDDWRRENVNRLVRELHEGIKRVKPTVLFGISPFGLPGPGRPAGIVGFDQYAKLYADAELWWREGWCDYFSPQLYWPIASKGQPFQPLLEFWAKEDAKGRHLWPGLSASRVGGTRGVPPEEITDQIGIIRDDPVATGNILFSFRPLARDQGGVALALKDGVYREPALVPETPWIMSERPAPPIVEPIERDGNEMIQLTPGSTGRPFLWAIRRRSAGGWTFETLPGDATAIPAGEVVVWAVGSTGNLSEPASAERSADASKSR